MPIRTRQLTLPPPWQRRQDSAHSRAGYRPALLFLTGILWLWLASELAAAKDTPSPTPAPGPTPTVDRLAAPPTVEDPTQADQGAQLFWLHCQPCHGDRGQGLTDEWRAQYPHEDQNCWQSGCHGNRPYENGFTLPTAVPPVALPGSLARFETLGQLHAYIAAAMPYHAPGSLGEEEYLAITAFLARTHDAGDGTTLSAANLATFRLRPPAATPLPLPGLPAAGETARRQDNPPPELLWLGGLAVLLVGAAWLWRRAGRP